MPTNSSNLKTHRIAMDRPAISFISGNQLIKGLLSFAFITLLSVLSLPAVGSGATNLDVQDFMASQPAPDGCYNWTENYTLDGLQGVKVWKRCGGDGILAYSEYWASGPLRWSQPQQSGSSCVPGYVYDYACDGANGTDCSAATWYKFEYFWNVNHYCDGTVVTTPVTYYPYYTYPYGVTSPCYYTTVGDPATACRSYDTLLADFFPICKDDEPCCNNPACDDPCGKSGGSGSGNNAGTAGNP